MNKLANQVQVGEVIEAIGRNFRVGHIEILDDYVLFFGQSTLGVEDVFKVSSSRIIRIIEGKSDFEHMNDWVKSNKNIVICRVK